MNLFWSDIRSIVWPRRGTLLLALALMIANRLAALALPLSTRFLIDDIVGKKRSDLIAPFLLAVLGATLVTSLSSYALTQVLAKAAHKLIADYRVRVQQHLGRVPVRYYDTNKT